MNNFSWNPFVLIKDFFKEDVKEEKVDSKKIENRLKKFLGVNPTYLTYRELKKRISVELHSEIGDKAPSFRNLRINICGTYSRIRGLRVMWNDYEYEVGKFELERK